MWFVGVWVSRGRLPLYAGNVGSSVAARAPGGAGLVGPGVPGCPGVVSVAVVVAVALLCRGLSMRRVSLVFGGGAAVVGKLALFAGLPACLGRSPLVCVLPVGLLEGASVVVVLVDGAVRASVVSPPLVVVACLVLLE